MSLYVELISIDKSNISIDGKLKKYIKLLENHINESISGTLVYFIYEILDEFVDYPKYQDLNIVKLLLKTLESKNKSVEYVNHISDILDLYEVDKIESILENWLKKNKTQCGMHWELIHDYYTEL